MKNQIITKTIIIFFLLNCPIIYANTPPTIEIKIEGVKGKLLENAYAHLSLEKQKNHPRLSKRRIQLLHKQASTEIKKSLQPFGYYHPTITADLKLAEKNVWQATYKVKSGEAVKIGEIDVQLIGEAKKDKIFQKQLNKLPIKTGEPFEHSNYEKIKRIFTNLAEERGYFEAKFIKNEVKVNIQTNTANIKLAFDSGPRYRFGEINFKQDLIEEATLRRFLTFKAGDYYTGTQLLNLKNALINSNYFSQVNININRAAHQNFQLPIDAILEPNKRNKYGVSIGYGTDTGARGRLEWRRRYINRYGHYFSLIGEFSEIRQGITANYFIPLGQDVENFLKLTASYKDEHTDTSESEIFLLGVSKNHSRTLFNTKISEIIGIEYRDEKYAVGSDTGHAKLLMPNIHWSYIKADDRIYTLKGQKIQFGLRGAISGAGSNTSFLQTNITGIFIRQPIKNGRIIAKGEFGYSIISLLDGDFHDLPPSIRFFAGGDKSVRGYDYQALGPKNAEGQVIGGKNLMTASLEYEQMIFGKWGAAVFYDVGNAFNDFSQALKHSVGIGARWRSPVGLIRIDIATSLSEDSYPVRLHITIGPDL